ncbi:MAG TPA: methionine gamma-lyase family protein [bacterium]|nr:methionine gamma-lyase family protein [bacterium]
MNPEDLLEEAESVCSDKIRKIREITRENELKVLSAFLDAGIDEYTVSFVGTGYGYGDRGRDALSRVFSLSLSAESAIVLPQIISGTHAISSALFALLRPKDRILSITGPVYDTLEKVIDSLKEWEIGYQEIPFEHRLDTDYIENSVKIPPKLIFIQRSCGYNWSRKSLTVDEIKNLILNIRRIFDESIILVDNCYGEFVEDREPLDAGADIIVGSLIKGIGGNLAHTGGYIAGKKEVIDRISSTVTAPGQGRDIGPTLGLQKDILQGLLFAPHFIGESLTGLTISSYILEHMGFETLPEWNEDRGDAVLRVILNDEKKLINFLEGIQSSCPVNSMYKPEPQELPGYPAPVILAGGGFVQGSTGEFSADGILKPPYVAFIQGGYSSNLVISGIIKSIKKVLEEG